MGSAVVNVAAPVAKTALGETELLAELPTVIGKLRRRLSDEARHGDFTPSQFSVIRRLFTDGPMTLTSLARADGMRPQSMGAIVSSLVSLGYVSGEPDPHDGRQTILSLTASAIEFIGAGRAAKQDWLFRTIDAEFSEAERRALAAAVLLMKRLADSQDIR
jgi:DNA-binding MarR family transcriptional regulator